jgi:hypothetical protein
VHIAAAISAYARMSINKYKNIKENNCIMSDTDSVVLSKKLNDNDIGVEIGKMKLESEFKNGIFIRKKLYYLEDINNDKYVIKASGVNHKNLNKNDFIDLLNGYNVKTKNLQFNVK